MKKIVIWGVFLGLKNATVDIFYILGRQKLKYLSKFSKIFSRPEVRLAPWCCFFLCFVCCLFFCCCCFNSYIFVHFICFIYYLSKLHSHFDSFVPSFLPYFFDSSILSFILFLHFFLVHSPFLLFHSSHTHSFTHLFLLSINHSTIYSSFGINLIIFEEFIHRRVLFGGSQEWYCYLEFSVFLPTGYPIARFLNAHTLSCLMWIYAFLCFSICLLCLFIYAVMLCLSICLSYLFMYTVVPCLSICLLCLFMYTVVLYCVFLCVSYVYLCTLSCYILCLSMCLLCLFMYTVVLYIMSFYMSIYMHFAGGKL